MDCFFFVVQSSSFAVFFSFFGMSNPFTASHCCCVLLVLLYSYQLRTYLQTNIRVRQCLQTAVQVICYSKRAGELRD